MAGLGLRVMALVAVVSAVCIAASAGPSIKASPAVLSGGSGMVTISWSGVAFPAEDDYIGFMSPFNTSIAPVGTQFVSVATDWQTGSGELVVEVVNTRADWRFGMWSNSGGSINRTMVAVSNSVTFSSYAIPTKVHLSLTSAVDEMRLMWISGDAQAGRCHYGAVNGTFGAVTKDSVVTTYSMEDMCGYPANDPDFFRSPGFIHDVVMVNLVPSTQVFYKCGSEAVGWYYGAFESSPPLGPSAYTTVAVFGDMGTSLPFLLYDNPDLNDVQPQSVVTVARMREKRPDLLLHTGDISYALGHNIAWDYFHNEVQILADNVPYMVAMGNHEYDYPGAPWMPFWANFGGDSWGECGVPYHFRFHMPGDNATVRNQYYSFNRGNIHFAVISSETNWEPGSAQHSWLRQDLAGVDRSLTPYVVLSLHRPMYSTSSGHMRLPIRQHLVDAVEPLLVEFNVQLVVAAHVHKYERTTPVVNATVDPRGPVHITVGTGGNTYQVGWDRLPVDHAFQPEWSSFRSQQFGFLLLDSTPDQLVGQYISNRDGKAHDYFEIPNVFGGGEGK